MESLNGFNPVGTNLLLKRKEAKEVTTGGIIVPEQARQNLTQGTIVKRGSSVSSIFQVGDEVVFRQHTEDPIIVDGQKLILVEDTNIVLHKKNDV